MADPPPLAPSTPEEAIKSGDEASNLQWSEEGEGGTWEDERKEVSVAVVKKVNGFDSFTPRREVNGSYRVGPLRPVGPWQLKSVFLVDPGSSKGRNLGSSGLTQCRKSLFGRIIRGNLG